jgi:hypothetical protein
MGNLERKTSPGYPIGQHLMHRAAAEGTEESIKGLGSFLSETS